MAAYSRHRGCRCPGSGQASALVCSDGKRAWRGCACRSGERRAGRRGGPGRWRGTSRGAGVPEPGLPAGRRYVEAPVRAGSGFRLGQEKRGEKGICVLLSAGKGMERRLSVPRGFMGKEGVRSEAAGGKEAAFLPGEQRAGRWAGGGGLRSSPPGLAPSGFAGRLSEALP